MIYNELILTFFKCLFNKNYHKTILKSELNIYFGTINGFLRFYYGVIFSKPDGFCAL